MQNRFLALLPSYVLLDLETTGSQPQRCRITEIAAVRIDHGQETARWSTLLNPETGIPESIQRLTGISNEMVESAPRFESIAAQLYALLEGAVLVAHNVQFDHGFLVQEFARIGQTLRVKTLCTVRLSRKLYPAQRSHSLDTIMQRHQLTTLARHRAMGDVELMQGFLHQAAGELGAETITQQAQSLLRGSAATPPFLETDIADIPDTPGVYLFYGAPTSEQNGAEQSKQPKQLSQAQQAQRGGLPIYIGKSIHLRTRVLSHFQAAGREARELRIAQEIRRVEWRETAGELGALLLEARLVKEMQPLLNRQLRKERALCAWRLAAAPSERPLVTLARGDELTPSALAQRYGAYRSKQQAVTELRRLATSSVLCLQALGLESGSGRCFAHQIGRCKGVCCGAEKPELHFLRLQLALKQHQLRAWPYKGKIGVREHNPITGASDLHIFDQWCHLATVQNETQLEDALSSQSHLAFDLDTYRLLVNHLSGRCEVIPLA